MLSARWPEECTLFRKPGLYCTNQAGKLAYGRTQDPQRSQHWRMHGLCRHSCRGWGSWVSNLHIEVQKDEQWTKVWMSKHEIEIWAFHHILTTAFVVQIWCSNSPLSFQMRVVLIIFIRWLIYHSLFYLSFYWLFICRSTSDIILSVLLTYEK